MIKHTAKVLLALGLTGCVSTANAGPLTLVKNGQPNATIVLQADAAPPVKRAAADLQEYLQKITGVQLPLTTDGKDVSGITLNVGKTETTIPSDFPSVDLNPETYAITQRNDDVYFEGNYPTPTGFAVHSFLQDQLGVRWFAPGEDWEYVPQHADKSTFTVDVKNLVSTPGISPRVWSGHRWNWTWKKWNYRNKVVVSERVPRRNFKSKMGDIFPPSQYAKTHPEYYPLENGKRYIPSSDKQRDWWPCIGNKEVQRITAEYIHQWFQDHPDQDSFSLGMDDIVHNCEGPLCRAMDAHPDDYANGHYSNRFYEFVNIVAKKVKKTDPGKYIGTLIYSSALELPENVPHIEDNIFGYIANGSVAQWYQPGKKADWMNRSKEWNKRLDHLSRYDYYGMGSFAPRIFPHAINESIKFDQSLGFGGMYTEIYTFLPHTAPMIWAFAQLQWNPEKNVDALLHDFYTKMFGEGAPVMQKYFDLMEKSWMTPRPDHVGWVHNNIVHQATSISPQALQQGLELLEIAVKKAQTPLEKKRIGIVQGGLQYAGYAIREYDLGQQLATLNINDSASAKLAFNKAKELGQVIKDRQVYWPQAKKRQDLLGANLRALHRYLQTDTTPLESPAVSTLIQLLDWYQQNQPQQANQLSLALRKAIPTGSVLDAAFAVRWVQQTHPKNLIGNGDFEVPGTAKAATKNVQEDWDTKNAPPHWATWSRLKQAVFKRVGGYDNGSGWSIATPVFGDNAALVQNVPVQAGQKYLAMSRVKIENLEEAANVKLSVRFRTDKGWATGSGTIKTISAQNIQGWQQLMLPVTIPEGITGVGLMLGVGPRMGAESKELQATFDDVAFYRLPNF